MFRWRWVMERGYHTGQPSVLDDLDSHLLQRRNWRGVGQDEFQRLLKAPWFCVLWAYLHETVSSFSRNKIPWPWWNYSSLSFFVLRQKMYYWFLIQPQTMWLREKSIEGGVRKPRFSPPNPPGRGGEGVAVWPWATVFTSLAFSFPGIKWKKWPSVLQFFSISKPMKSSPSPKT